MGANVLIAAVQRYAGKGYTYAYGAGHTGAGAQVDCSGLVYNALKDAGYSVPASGTNFNTGTLFNGSSLTSYATKNFDSIPNPGAKNGHLQMGDLVLFKSNTTSNQHVGIFYGYDAKGNPMFYGSQTKTGPAIAVADGAYWDSSNVGESIVGALRPKDIAYNAAADTTLALTKTTGIAPVAAIPGDPALAPNDPGMHYFEINSSVQKGRLYDNGVLYTVDVQTGIQHWSIPTGSGGTREVYQSPNGQVTEVMSNIDVSTGNYTTDQTAAFDPTLNLTQIQNFVDGISIGNGIAEGQATSAQLAQEAQLASRLSGATKLADAQGAIFGALGIRVDAGKSVGLQAADRLYTGSNIAAAPAFASDAGLVSWLDKQAHDAGAFIGQTASRIASTITDIAANPAQLALEDAPLAVKMAHDNPSTLNVLVALQKIAIAGASGANDAGWRVAV